MFDFRAPLFLLLLAAIPLLIYGQQRAHRGAAQWRKSVIFCLRGTALLCAILALADLHRTHKARRLAIVFLIDASESIPPEQHEKVLKEIDTAAARLKPTDQFGIISFAGETSVLQEIRPEQDVSPEDWAAVLPRNNHRTDVRRGIAQMYSQQSNAPSDCCRIITIGGSSCSATADITPGGLPSKTIYPCSPQAMLKY